jgi:hypothetical protein
MVRITKILRVQIIYFTTFRYFEGKELVSEGRYKIEVNDEHGTASLQIEKLEESDIGVVSTSDKNLD